MVMLTCLTALSPRAHATTKGLPALLELIWVTACLRSRNFTTSRGIRETETLTNENSGTEITRWRRRPTK